MFLIQSTSGRDFTTQQTADVICQKWDIDSTNDDDVTLGEWLEFADIGDTFEDAENRVTFTRIA